MKGPNAPFASIDIFHAEVKPKEWRNVPVPLVESIELLNTVLLDVKKAIHANFNETV